MEQNKTLYTITFILSLVALTVAVLALFSGRSTPADTPPVTGTLPTGTLPEGTTLISYIGPSQGVRVSLPFEITVQTTKPAAAGISSADCESTVPGQGVHFQALLALDSLPQSTTSTIQVSRESLGVEPGTTLTSCTFSITAGTTTDELESKEVTYQF